MFTPLNIALIEDHLALREATANMLRQEGYRIFEMASTQEMPQAIGGEVIHIFIVDLNLPGEDGLMFISRLLTSHSNAGVIVATARGTADHIAEGYRSGADVYLVKPVNPKMLLAAIESVRRRLVPSATKESNFRLETASCSLVGLSGRVQLTKEEAALIISMMRSPDRTIQHEQIADLMGRSKDTLAKPNIEVRITRLRKKLAVASGTEGPWIIAHRAKGYQLCMDVQII